MAEQMMDKYLHLQANILFPKRITRKRKKEVLCFAAFGHTIGVQKKNVFFTNRFYTADAS